MKAQKCPVCEGTGQIWNATPECTSAGYFRSCHACGGTGVVYVPDACCRCPCACYPPPRCCPRPKIEPVWYPTTVTWSASWNNKNGWTTWTQRFNFPF